MLAGNRGRPPPTPPGLARFIQSMLFGNQSDRRPESVGSPRAFPDNGLGGLFGAGPRAARIDPMAAWRQERGGRSSGSGG